MNKAIGENIRLMRIKLNMSQENMAMELDLSTGAYSNLERGKTEITINRLFKLAEIFGVQAVDLIHPPNRYLKLSEPNGEQSDAYMNMQQYIYSMMQSLKVLEQRLLDVEKRIEQKAPTSPNALKSPKAIKSPKAPKSSDAAKSPNALKEPKRLKRHY